MCTSRVADRTARPCLHTLDLPGAQPQEHRYLLCGQIFGLCVRTWTSFLIGRDLLHAINCESAVAQRVDIGMQRAMEAPRRGAARISDRLHRNRQGSEIAVDPPILQLPLRVPAPAAEA